MAHSTTYTIEQFVEAVREAFAGSRDPRAQAQAVAAHMAELLATPNLLEEMSRRAGGQPGRVNLHIDEDYGHPGPGFCLMSTVPAPGSAQSRERQAPHDHGASWVVYGVYRGAIQQTKYRWGYPREGAWTSPELKQGECFIQRAGQVAFFLPGEIHAADPAGDEQAIVVRLEAQLLDRVLRHRYDLEASAGSLQQSASAPTA